MTPPVEEGIRPTEVEFGEHTDANGVVHSVKIYTFTNKNGVTAQVIDFGVTLISVKVPDRDGNVEDVVLGFDTFDDYIKYQSAYIGSTIGRVCNRVSTGSFTVDDQKYELTKNVKDAWQLHGGFTGLSFVVWKSHIVGNKVVFSYLSPDGEEGYPGNLLVQVDVWLTECNGVKFVCRAITDQATPVSLTNHAYFNLAGHGSGYQGLGEHTIVVNADRYLVCDDDMVPTGEVKPVGVPEYFDLRVARQLADMIPLVPLGGYDQNFRISGCPDEGVRFVARLVHPPSGRVMEVFSDQPCAVLYTSRNLPQSEDPPEKQVMGKGGACYQQFGAICIEPQAYPDAVNKPDFPPVILNPGDVYKSVMVFKFRVEQEAGVPPPPQTGAAPPPAVEEVVEAPPPAEEEVVEAPPPAEEAEAPPPAEEEAEATPPAEEEGEAPPPDAEAPPPDDVVVEPLLVEEEAAAPPPPPPAPADKPPCPKTSKRCAPKK